VQRPHHREVLECHLGGTVLADRDPGVGTEDVQVGAADRGHPQEVVGAGQERGEGARVRLPAAHPDADGGRDELLLGDVALDVPLRVLLGEQLRLGGVADLAVEHDDVLAAVPVTVSASPKAVRVATLSPTS